MSGTTNVLTKNLYLVCPVQPINIIVQLYYQPINTIATNKYYYPITTIVPHSPPDHPAGGDGGDVPALEARVPAAAAAPHEEGGRWGPRGPGTATPGNTTLRAKQLQIHGKF